MLEGIDQSLGDLYLRHDGAPGDESRAEALQGIRDALNRRRYVANLLRDVEKELNVHLSN